MQHVSTLTTCSSFAATYVAVYSSNNVCMHPYLSSTHVRKYISTYVRAYIFFGPPCVNSPTSSFGLIRPFHFSCDFSTASYDPSTSHVTSPLPHTNLPLLMSLLHCLIYPRCTPHPGGPPQLLLQRPVASASPSREAPSSATADVPYDS